MSRTWDNGDATIILMNISRISVRLLSEDGFL